MMYTECVLEWAIFHFTEMLWQILHLKIVIKWGYMKSLFDYLYHCVEWECVLTRKTTQNVHIFPNQSRPDNKR